MAKPLQTEERGQPKSMQFAHLGVLDSGSQSKASTAVSVLLNAILLAVFIIVSAAAKKTLDNNRRLTALTEPIVQKKAEPVKPKPVPPPPKPPPPQIDLPKVEIQLPRRIVPIVKQPDMPKPPDVKMEVLKPIIAAPAPAKVTPMAAPVKVDLSKLQAANSNAPRASSVTLGNQTNPTLHGPSVSSVNLTHGVPGPSGNGPTSTQVNLGGSPTGTGRGTGSVQSVGLGGSPTGSPRGTGSVQSVGLAHGGVPSGTGTARVASQVNLAAATPQSAPKSAPVASLVQPKPAKVVAKPRPEYTAEARQLHIEGTVILRIRVMPNGAVADVNVVSGLGHGLDESARRAIQATKFEPATDGLGHPVEWDGIVNVVFQLAG
jgi:TonB family protein